MFFIILSCDKETKTVNIIDDFVLYTAPPAINDWRLGKKSESSSGYTSYSTIVRDCNKVYICSNEIYVNAKEGTTVVVIQNNEMIKKYEISEMDFSSKVKDCNEIKFANNYDLKN